MNSNQNGFPNFPNQSSREGFDPALISRPTLEEIKQNPLLLDEATLNDLEQSDPELATELVDEFMYRALGQYGLEDAQA